VRINTPAVNHQSIDGEVVAINLATGAYYSLRNLAAAIWERVEAGLLPEAILAEAVTVYGEEARPAVENFLRQLVDEGLLVDGSHAASIEPAPLPATFRPPLFEKFTDMQELLLLDPIHEVDEIGWPHRPV
jgi:Coenzyme PQQ synthesis protein D (PqqD)